MLTRCKNVNGGPGSQAKRVKKNFRPPPGSPEKLQPDCLVVTNSANCFMLFILIVNSTKSFVKPVV